MGGGGDQKSLTVPQVECTDQISPDMITSHWLNFMLGLASCHCRGDLYFETFLLIHPIEGQMLLMPMLMVSLFFFLHTQI